jgi:CheY-like chemotaxis protein
VLDPVRWLVLPALQRFSSRSALLPDDGTSRLARDGASTILVVEDDRAIRYLFTEVLRNNGYAVIACEDGARGLEVARARIAEIDAVITDSRMPGIDGAELIAHIRALRPEMPILVVSGHLENRAPDAATCYLAKPLSPERLTRELRRALDAASPGPVR